MNTISQNLKYRYGEELDVGPLDQAQSPLAGMVARGSCRDFMPEEVDPALTQLLCATALAAPTKSDLQQRDIIILRDQSVKKRLIDLVGPDTWLADAPNFAVFCGNNRRQRKLHQMHGHRFANDHLDAFFNAAVDAGIALSAFITAAEHMGLGCCPVSAIRNEAEAVSDLLGLPDHVFPVAGLAFGYRRQATPKISMRLPLSATVHTDRYSETDIEAKITEYDQRREAAQPYASQTASDVFGVADDYGWSEDKSRQYALPERQDFGDFIRRKGFDLS